MQYNFILRNNFMSFFKIKHIKLFCYANILFEFIILNFNIIWASVVKISKT